MKRNPRFEVMDMGDDIYVVMREVWFSVCPSEQTIIEPPAFMRRLANAILAECDKLEGPKTVIIPVAAVQRLAHQQAAEHADPVAAEVQAAIRVTGEDAQLCGKCGQVFCECPAAVEFVDAMEFAGPTS